MDEKVYRAWVQELVNDKEVLVRFTDNTSARVPLSSVQILNTDIFADMAAMTLRNEEHKAFAEIVCAGCLQVRKGGKQGGRS